MKQTDYTTIQKSTLHWTPSKYNAAFTHT